MVYILEGEEKQMKYMKPCSVKTDEGRWRSGALGRSKHEERVEDDSEKDSEKMQREI